MSFPIHCCQRCGNPNVGVLGRFFDWFLGLHTHECPSVAPTYEQEALKKIDAINRKYSTINDYMKEANAIIEPLIPNRYEANTLLPVPAELYDRASELIQKAYKMRGVQIPPGQKVLTFEGPCGELRLIRRANEKAR